MTRRGTGNRQKKIVAPRGSRGGERSLHPTTPRPAPTAETPKEGARGAKPAGRGNGSRLHPRNLSRKTCDPRERTIETKEEP